MTEPLTEQQIDHWRAHALGIINMEKLSPPELGLARLANAAELLACRLVALLAERRRLREALADIVDPIGAFRREAKAKGATLSSMAYQIANDPNTLKGIARKALGEVSDATSN